MIDMKLATKGETMLASPSEDDGPEYPYGLRITLDAESLAKLGITELPPMDAEMKLTALCCVVAASQSESRGGEMRRTLDLQIEQMALAPAAEEDDKERKPTTSVMYES